MIKIKTTKRKKNKILIFSFSLIIIAFFTNGCNKKNANPDKQLKITNPNDIKFPVDLNKNREDFLSALFKSNTPESKELLRQYLFDQDATIVSQSLKFLDLQEDKPTLVERYVLKNPNIEEKSISQFLANVEDKDVLQQIIYHTLTKVYRPELKNVRLYESEKRIGFKEYLFEYYFSYKDDRGSGGREGVLEPDKLSIKKKVSTWDSGWRQLESFEEKKISDQDFFENRPITGAWTKFVPNTSCPPICFNGRFYMGDGNGNLICSDLISGETFWKTPFPIPPYAQVTANSSYVSVKFECDIENFFIAQFSASNGNLAGFSIEKKIQREIPSYKEDKFEITFLYKDKSYLMTSKSDQKINWEQKIFCTPKQFWVSGNIGYLLGKWSNHYFALGAFDIKTGKPIWCQPIECGENLKFHFQNKNLIWLIDEESVVMCIDKNNGKTALNIRLSEEHYSIPVTGISWDKKTDRILIDPSNGAIYSFPIKSLIKSLGFKSPKDETSTFAHSFQLDVMVKKINRSFKSIPEISPKINENEEDSPETIYQPAVYLDRILFNAFANTFHESKFSGLGRKGWFQNWGIYEKKLIEKARDQKLDFKSLKECLLKIKPKPDDEIAFIPVNAFECIVEEKLCWVIVCKWEYNLKSNDENDAVVLSHVRMWAISKDEKKIIGFSTCN